MVKNSLIQTLKNLELKYKTMKIRKIIPFLPIIGIILTPIFEMKYRDTGLENMTVLMISGILQGIYIGILYLFIPELVILLLITFIGIVAYFLFKNIK